MKRSERHHLKQNPVAAWAADVSAFLADRGRQVFYLSLALAALAIAAAAFAYWRAQEADRANALLTRALAISEAPVLPPGEGTEGGGQVGAYPSEAAKLEAALNGFVAVLEQYPSSDAALPALYQAAAVLAALGRHAEAEQRYRELTTRDRGGIYGEMAELGLAQALAAAGRHDEAIDLFVRLSTATDGRLPVEGILMQLAGAYRAAGRTAEAAQAYRRVITEFPQSPYAADARQAVDQIEKS